MFGDALHVFSTTSLRFEVEAEDETSWFSVPPIRTHRTEYAVNGESIAAVCSEVPKSLSLGLNVKQNSPDPLPVLHVSGRIIGTFLELQHAARDGDLHVRLKGNDALVERGKAVTTTDLQTFELAEAHQALDAVLQPGPIAPSNAKGADHAFSDAFLNEVSFGHAGSDRLVDKTDTVNIQIHLGHDVVSAGSGDEVMISGMSEPSAQDGDTAEELEGRWNGEDSDTFVWSGRKSSFQRQHSPGLNVKTAC
jgi:hypothetical protein